MLDGLLGRGFSAKCKSLIKTTRARIEVVKRKPEAKQRFLKEDLAKLLANGLDINAFGRTEEFLAGANLLGAYDFIDQTCEYITTQLSCMQKQRDCPEECREAVGSLMFAAARFSELPELRDLRDVFQERYGNSLDCYVHQKFLEKLSSNPPEKEKKIHLLRDIASEYSVKWDSYGFEQRMCTPSPIPQPQTIKHGKYNLHMSEKSVPRSEKRELIAKERPELLNGTFKREDIINGREGNFVRKKESINIEQNVPIKDKYQEVRVEKFRSRNEKEKDGRVNSVRLIDSSSHGLKIKESRDEKLEATPSNRNIVSKKPDLFISTPRELEKRKINEEESEKLRSVKNSVLVLPPPYVKPNNSFLPPPYIKPSKGTEYANKDHELVKDRNKHERTISQPKLAFNHDEESYKLERDRSKHERTISEPKFINAFGHEDIAFNQENMIPLPKPRSVRRKHHKSSSSNINEFNSLEDIGSSSTRTSRRKDHSNHSKNVKDDEEKMIDKLLLHYSKKQLDIETGISRKGESSSRDRREVREDLQLPKRSVSLPNEQGVVSEDVKVFERANSFQPDDQIRHVHPKLPDYDDLAARFASLRGR